MKRDPNWDIAQYDAYWPGRLALSREVRATCGAIIVRLTGALHIGADIIDDAAMIMQTFFFDILIDVDAYADENRHTIDFQITDTSTADSTHIRFEYDPPTGIYTFVGYEVPNQTRGTSGNANDAWNRAMRGI